MLTSSLFFILVPVPFISSRFLFHLDLILSKKAAEGKADKEAKNVAYVPPSHVSFTSQTSLEDVVKHAIQDTSAEPIHRGIKFAVPRPGYLMRAIMNL